MGQQCINIMPGEGKSEASHVTAGTGLNAEAIKPPKYEDLGSESVNQHGLPNLETHHFLV